MENKKLESNELLDAFTEKFGRRFTYVDYLGSGSYSDVYLMIEKKRRRMGAIKLMNSNRISKMLSNEDQDEIIRQINKNKIRFTKEAETYKNFNHPNIAHIYDAGFFHYQTDDLELPYIFMEYIEGQDLSHFIKSQAPLNTSRAIQIIGCVLAALSNIHKINIIHRDVKPKNIMIPALGKAVLIDFGLVKNLINDSNLTTTGTAIGTPNYMAPEQFEFKGKTDIETDIYACGVLFFEMLTGKVPYVYNDTFGIMQAHLHEPVPDIRDQNPSLPFGIDKITRKAMAKKMCDRYRSSSEMWEDIKQIL